MTVRGGSSDQQGTNEETPVPNKTFDLIQQFIDQRSDYRPRKARQTHWALLHTESKTRLDDLLSISSELQKSAQKRRTTPSRTPLLNMMKRPTTPFSSTPMSSNKKDVRVQEHEITSWTFINSLVQRRAKLCASSCEEFRAQSFLGELHTECDGRVKTLHVKLEQLKSGNTSNGDDEPVAKRQKTDGNGAGFYFFRDYQSLDAHSSDADQADSTTTTDTAELINETQIKLCLWSNLLGSVKEIVDEK